MVVEEGEAVVGIDKGSREGFGFQFQMGCIVYLGLKFQKQQVGPRYVLAQVKVKFFLFWFSSVKKKIQKIQNGSVGAS